MLKSSLKKWFVIPLAVMALSAGLLAACDNAQPTTPTTPTTPTAPALTGTIEIDGSSTVYPITEAVAEEFGKVQRQVRVNVGISGTGGGFKRFVVGETQISDASRVIKSSEAEAAAKNNIEYIEMPVAYDGISIVVNPKNTWATSITTEELKRLWEPGSTIKLWSEIRSGWPEQPINLYGPGTDSGTFDYFTEAINHKEKASRADYTASEDDNVLVRGVSGDANALGYFGFAYYEENKDKLKLVPVDAGKGPVLPSLNSIMDGTYKPLARQIYIYVNKAALSRPEVKEFVLFYMKEAAGLVAEVGYVPLSASQYEANAAKAK